MSETTPVRANWIRDSLSFVGTRRVLMTVAEMACKLSKEEFLAFQKTVLGEIAALTPDGEHPDIWKQAVEAAKLNGVLQYGLQRIGLHPTEKRDPEEEPEPPKRKRGAYRK